MTDYLVLCGSLERSDELFLKAVKHLKGKDDKDAVSYSAWRPTRTINMWGLLDNPFERVRIRFSPLSESDVDAYPKVKVVSAEAVENYLKTKEDISE